MDSALQENVWGIKTPTPQPPNNYPSLSRNLNVLCIIDQRCTAMAQLLMHSIKTTLKWVWLDHY